MTNGHLRDDATLVRRSQDRELAAYGELLSRYERTARVVALRYLRDHGLAEDAVQEAFVAAFRRMDSLRDGSRFGPWLLRIVEREALRMARRSRGETALDDAPEPESREGKEASLSADLEEAVLLIDRLAEHERVVVTLHYLDQLSTPEIAQVTGRPLGTVTKQLSRAMTRLRQWARPTD